MNRELLQFIEDTPTAFHAVENASKMLLDAGYVALNESESWNLEHGKKYFVARNGSSLIAFKVPQGDLTSFMITASHGDSPCFKIKENSELKDANFTRLSTEKYGSLLFSTWLDKVLSVAGKVTVRTANGIRFENVDLKENVALIPNVALHMNRDANDNMCFNPAVDMIPLYSGKSLMERIAEKIGVTVEDIVSTDLFLYNPQKPIEWGEYISAPRLDDLQCAYACLKAFISSNDAENVSVYCLFDNEEVGSETKQGAASTFLFDTLKRLTRTLGLNGVEYRKMVANSCMLSCDNAHALHPNHPEYVDKNHTSKMNGGVVIKYNANQRYTSDSVSAAIVKIVCESVNVPYQYYANRADMHGGFTLGNIANTHVSLNTVDIGLAQLAMHSAYETAGAKDTEYMITAVKKFYETVLRSTENGIEIK